jgi:hypothetical protein
MLCGCGDDEPFPDDTPPDSPAVLMNYTADDDDWLGTQRFKERPGVTLEDIRSVIDRWISRYTTELFEQAWTDSNSQEYAALARKLWHCWRYHWQMEATIAGTIIDGIRVAD